MTRLEYLEGRLAQLNSRIAEVKQWGALLTALDEERGNILYYIEREKDRMRTEALDSTEAHAIDRTQ